MTTASARLPSGRRAAVFAVAATLALLAAGPAAAEDIPCPTNDFRPLVKREEIPALMQLIFPPLMVIDGLSKDNLVDKPRRPVGLVVVDAAGKPVAGVAVAAIRDDGPRYLANGIGGDKPVALPDGGYSFIAVAPGKPLRWGQAKAKVGTNGAKTVTIKLTATADPVEAQPIAAAIPGGAALDFRWQGLHQDGAQIVLTKPGDTAHESVADANVMPDGESSTMQLPATPGRYEARLLLCAPRITLASWSVTIVRPDISVTAPASAKIGAPVSVKVGGGFKGAGAVAIVPHGATDDLDTADWTAFDSTAAAESLDPAAAEGGLSLHAPLAPGAYDVAVRVGSDNKVVARAPLTVEAAPISISVPASLEVGQAIEQPSWTGDAGDLTELHVWRIGPKPGKSVLVTDRFPPPDHRVLLAPGDYELRVVGRHDADKIWARQPLKVTGTIFGEVPGHAKPGETLTLDLGITGGFFDAIHVVKRGGDPDGVEVEAEADARPDGKTAVELTLPAKPGRYDILYIGDHPGGTNAVLDRRPIEVK